MHSSRMRTGRSLTVCCSLLPGGDSPCREGGLPGPGEGFSLLGGCLPDLGGGVSAWSQGVLPAGGGVCLIRGWGCLPYRGGFCLLGGVCLVPGGFSLPGGPAWSRGVGSPCRGVGSPCRGGGVCLEIPPCEQNHTHM